MKIKYAAALWRIMRSGLLLHVCTMAIPANNNLKQTDLKHIGGLLCRDATSLTYKKKKSMLLCALPQAALHPEAAVGVRDRRLGETSSSSGHQRALLQEPGSPDLVRQICIHYLNYAL